MIKEIAANLHQIEIPLPNNSMKAVNSYVIKNEQNLVIDTGWNREECMEVMTAGLRELEVNKDKTDFFITHFHSDHFGLIPHLSTDKSKIYFNQPDAHRLKYRLDFLGDEINFASLHGYPDHEVQAIRSHPRFKQRSRGNSINFTMLKEGDRIDIGDFAFTCIETPGHTQGHMCLYEPNKKIFVAGDHILAGMTVKIQSWSDGWNPVKEYLSSLKRIFEFDIELVLPGHNGIIRNCKERIHELQQHHERILDEISHVLEKGGWTAYQVASRLSWNSVDRSWDSMAISHKWVATGEAIAHLKYLEDVGTARRETWKGKVLFFST